MTEVYVNKEGLDFRNNPNKTYDVIQSSSSGYAKFDAVTIEWTGINLKYKTGYLMPLSGTITKIQATSSKPDLIYSVYSKYNIKASDISASADYLFWTIVAQDNINWFGGSNDDKFYFAGNNDTIDGGGGNDTLVLSQNFSYYSFSNINSNTSSIKITRNDSQKTINLISIEKYIFQDKNILFSDIPPEPNNYPTGAATIKGLATWGTTLSITNTIKDADGIGKLSYTWQNDKTTLSTNATYMLVDSDIGKQVWAVVSYTDKKGNLEEVKSNTINVTISDKASAVNDVLTGTQGADKLNGLAGNDTLIGGLGKDSLTGGVGADVFKFNSANDSSALPKQADTITDFKHAQGDKIDLSAINANSVLPSDQAFTLISATTFSVDATGQLRFDAKTSTLYGSTNADAAPEFAIVLSGVKTLVAEDLIL